MVTQDLFLAATFCSLMHAMLSRACGPRARAAHAAFLIAGTAASAALAIVKFNTRLIISSHWNHYLYAAILVLTAVFLLFTAAAGRKDTLSSGVPGGSGASAVLIAAGGALSAVLIFYSLPSVLLYPFNFNTMGNGYFSSYYLVRIAGWALALLLLLVYSALLSRCALRVRPYGIVPAVLNTGLLTFSVYCFGRFFVPWVNRAKWLKWPVRYSDEAYGWIGKHMMFTANHSMLFLWIPAALVLLLSAWFFLTNLRVTDPYEHAAGLRKLKARNRSNRCASAGIAACLLLTAVTLTAVKAWDTRVIELSAPETYAVRDGTILVPVDAVSDGHLHRFEYRTAKNVDVRWIVVKKPGSASFGVGLDACEVCGNAGYFERGGQVVCKRCDVVMNINTIGFKGGCNPIPLAYEVADGNLVFRIEDIEAGEKEFR